MDHFSPLFHYLLISVFLWIVCLFTLISLVDYWLSCVACVARMDRRSCGSGSTCRCLVLLSRILDLHTLHIYLHFTYFTVCIRYSVLLLFLLFLFGFFCCYFLTANACRFILGEGSVPGRSSWGLFTQLKGSFFLQHGTFNPNPHSNQVSRDRGCCCTVQTVKPIEEIWLWFWAI